MLDVASWPFEKRLGETITRTLPKLAPEVREQFAALVAPASLAVMATVVFAWIISHAFAVGEIVDIIIAAAGILSLGLAVFSGLDHLYEFAAGTYSARNEPDLDRAAEHLAKAVGILGVQAVLAVLFRRVPQTWRGKPVIVGPRPPRPPRVFDVDLPPGVGGHTSPWGDISLSRAGTAAQRAENLLHERVHQFLVPRLQALRHVRVEMKWGSYVRSSLWRYFEEALAESITQVGFHGFRNLFRGIRFPTRHGYVYLLRAGGSKPWMGGMGLLQEGAGLLAGGTIMGMSFEVWYRPAVTHATPVSRPAVLVGSTVSDRR